MNLLCCNICAHKVQTLTERKILVLKFSKNVIKKGGGNDPLKP